MQTKSESVELIKNLSIASTITEIFFFSHRCCCNYTARKIQNTTKTSRTSRRYFYVFDFGGQKSI